MDVLYQTEEQYLQAVEELKYGETPQALYLFKAIIASDPDYARAYYQLGYIYCCDFKDYQTAGYYFKRCMELDPDFPDVYVHYLKLLVTLRMHNAVLPAAQKALLVPGVCESCVYRALGQHAESLKDLSTAQTYYHKALAANTDTNLDEDLHKQLLRITAKVQASRKTVYTCAE